MRNLLIVIVLSLFSLLTTSCIYNGFKPPFHHYRPYDRSIKNPMRIVTRSTLIRELQEEDIQYVQYGDIHTILIPTDKYYVFNSTRINDVCYPGLMTVIKLLRYYPRSVFYVGGFTDDIGSRFHKNRLSQGQAESMLTFLWAHSIRAQRLSAEGYGDKYNIGQNNLIHGSAYNRRVEIQWYAPCLTPPLRSITK